MAQQVGAKKTQAQIRREQILAQERAERIRQEKEIEITKQQFQKVSLVNYGKAYEQLPEWQKKYFLSETQLREKYPEQYQKYETQQKTYEQAVARRDALARETALWEQARVFIRKDLPYIPPASIREKVAILKEAGLQSMQEVQSQYVQYQKYVQELQGSYISPEGYGMSMISEEAGIKELTERGGVYYGEEFRYGVPPPEAPSIFEPSWITKPTFEDIIAPPAVKMVRAIEAETAKLEKQRIIAETKEEEVIKKAELEREIRIRQGKPLYTDAELKILQRAENIRTQLGLRKEEARPILPTKTGIIAPTPEAELFKPTYEKAYEWGKQFLLKEPGEEYWKAVAGYPEVVKPKWKEEPIKRLRVETGLGIIGGAEMVKYWGLKPFKVIKESIFEPSGELVSKGISPWAGAPITVAGEFIPTTPAHLGFYYGIGKAYKFFPKITPKVITGIGAYEFYKAETPEEYVRAGALVTAGVAPVIVKKILTKTQVNRDLSRLVKEGKISKSESKLFKVYMKDIKTINARTYGEIKIKKVDFSGMKNLPKKVHGPTKNYIRIEKDVLGGSLAMRSQLGVKVPKGRFALSDLDIYTKANVNTRALTLAAKYKALGIERVNVVPNTGRITIKGVKVAEYHSLDMLYGNIESVSAWYKPSRLSIKKDPTGIKVAPTLNIQAQRNLIRAYMETTDYAKHMMDFRMIRQTMRKQYIYEKKLMLPEEKIRWGWDFKIKKVPKITFKMPEIIPPSPPLKKIVPTVYKPFAYPTYPKYPLYPTIPIYPTYPKYPKYPKIKPLYKPSIKLQVYPIIKLPYKPLIKLPKYPPKKPPYKPPIKPLKYPTIKPPIYKIPIYKPPKKPPYKPPIPTKKIIPLMLPTLVLVLPKPRRIVKRKVRKKIIRKPTLWALAEKIYAPKPTKFEPSGLVIRPIIIEKLKKKKRISPLFKRTLKLDFWRKKK